MSANTNNGNEPVKYAANDWFYMKRGVGEECDATQTPNPLCIKNQLAVQSLQSSTNTLGASTRKYNDSKMLYNRELLFTVNMLVGLAGICYYIYVNQSAIPSPASALKGIESIGNALKKSPLPTK